MIEIRNVTDDTKKRLLRDIARPSDGISAESRPDGVRDYGGPSGRGDLKRSANIPEAGRL
jgi:hypothetical protein